MTTVINVPPSLDDITFEQVLEQAAPLAPDAKILLDARHVRWASPYGLTALLTFGESRSGQVALTGPEADETASYWSRSNFYKHAADVFELHGHVPRTRPGSSESNVLLEITQVAKSGDVHDVVTRVGERAGAILKSLNLESKATMRFATTLSEVCQNIVEHAEGTGWVAVQAYQYRQRLAGRRVVQIAVCDSGIGFRKSLEQSPSFRPNDRWDDARALEEAVIRGVSRFRERGRGQGLENTRKFVGGWDGKLSVRSGTARIALVPNWDEDLPLTEGLPPFPGSQVQITIPERITARI